MLTEERYARILKLLEDKGSVFFGCRFHDTLDNFHVVNVECADGISVLICRLEHFFGCYQWHDIYLRVNNLFY